MLTIKNDDGTSYEIDTSMTWEVDGKTWAIGRCVSASGRVDTGVFVLGMWKHAADMWSPYELWRTPERAAEFMRDLSTKQQQFAAVKAAESRMHRDMAQAFARMAEV